MGYNQPRSRRRGFTLIELLIVISIILVIVAIAIPNGQKMLMSAHETAAISEIKSIQQGQAQFYAQFGRYAVTLTELGPPAAGVGILPGSLAKGKKSGYLFSLTATPTGYSLSAVPERFEGTGRRTFYADQELVIRNNWSSDPATTASPEI
jgi:type IV pilus assembly protein PilA